MKRGLTVTVAAAAILAAGLSGCSNDKSSTGSGSSAPSSGSSSAASASAGGGGGGSAGIKVIIDGKDQQVSGSVVCTTVGGNVNIAVGGAATGIAAVLSDANPPAVKSVALGNVNGVTLGYSPGAGGGNGTASATKNGNSYKITGTATGIDMANPMQPVDKPFEIDVTCS